MAFKKLKLWFDKKLAQELAEKILAVKPDFPSKVFVKAVSKQLKPLLPILNNLKDDPSKYVQKSVANCLNDILKDNPEILKNVIEKWNKRPSLQR